MPCITRASLLAQPDRSFRIRSKQEEICAISFLHMDLFVFEYGNCWFEICPLNWSSAHPKAARWRSLDEIDRSKYTVAADRIWGYEVFNGRAIDWDWSIDQGRADVLITAPPASWQENKIGDRSLIFVGMSLQLVSDVFGCIWSTGKRYFGPRTFWSCWSFFCKIYWRWGQVQQVIPYSNHEATALFLYIWFLNLSFWTNLKLHCLHLKLKRKE